MRIAPLVILLAFFGCSGNSNETPQMSEVLEHRGVVGTLYTIDFCDVTGRLVATAELQLPDPLPASGSFEGQWQLVSSTEGFPPTFRESESYRARLNNDEIVINLNPNVRDNNVILIGTISSGVRNGTWEHATFVGAKHMGTFTLAK